ncbi:L,D-transpeptidase [Paenibacillus pasadenensis]|uniref:L,D-transpeptidase n=1 Tax=Paenibacillus pasadenensis TaxID=217090 RepID=UPI00203F3421|nr:L,D-transpeptidase [Paenibacillus pasadenensis]MCM3747155.1 L,D-transpeptidase [Paenibacillus pasadenensis]
MKRWASKSGSDDEPSKARERELAAPAEKGEAAESGGRNVPAEKAVDSRHAAILTEAALERRLGELKKYVSNHPHNKMAWFLLGKTYARLGKEGKANYCYIRSGPIYEAYENTPHPYENSMLPADELLDSWNEEPRQNWKPLVVLLAALLGVLLMPAISQAPGTVQEEQPGAAAESKDGTKINEKPEKQPAAAAVSPGKDKPSLVWVDSRSFAEGAAAAASAVSKDNGNRQAVAVTLPQAGRHFRWELPAVGTAFASRADKNGSYVLDEPAGREECRCESGLNSAVDAELAAMKAAQEQRWSVVSGIRSYRRMNGKWPASLSDLTRPYPDNILAGAGKGMKERFPEWLEEARAAETGGTASGGTSAAAAQERQTSGQGELAAAMSESLRIVVDIKSYRLALMSGPVAVRVYPVGLGGSKTPLGQFAVSEKVRNPNGSSTGPFGSRGMTLSDTRYAIHGTDEPDSIGKDKSLGCVRMSRADVEELFDLVPIGTPVTIQSGGLGQLEPQKPNAKKSRYSVRPVSNEENPNKVYDWL